MPHAATATAPPARSLAPREHGAYGQLGVPLAAALGSGRPGVAALALAAAAIAAFLAHEPALVLLGERGPRVRRDHGRRAWQRGLALGGFAAVAGALGLVVGGATVAVAALAALGLAALTALAVARGAEKSLPGELVAASALAAAAVPVAIAGGAAPAVAAAAWTAWTLGFAAVTVAVRAVIARGKRRTARWAPPVVLGLVALGVALAAGPTPHVAAAAPLAAVAVSLTVAPPAPRHLRRIGWALVAASVATGAALVALARLAWL